MSKISKKSQILWKKAKICGWNLEKHSITIKNYTPSYFQTLEEVPRPLRPEKPKNWQKFSKKTWKKVQVFKKKLLKFVIFKNWKLNHGK